MTCFVACAFTSRREPPLAFSAVFSASGSSFTISFDQDTDMRHNGDCSRFFAESSFEVCSWSKPSEMTVILSLSASLSPGDAITILGANIVSADGVSGAADDVVLSVVAPDVLDAPTVELNGPSSVSECDAVVFQAVGAVGRNMTYVWTSDAATLASTLSLVSDPFVEISGAQLSVSPIRLSVIAVSILGSRSAPSTITVCEIFFQDATVACSSFEPQI